MMGTYTLKKIERTRNLHKCVGKMEFYVKFSSFNYALYALK